MTKRSSFVMPPVLAGVATMVDILDRSRESLMQTSSPCAGLGRIESWASVQGNIAVKPLPIRLLAPSAILRLCGGYVVRNTANLPVRLMPCCPTCCDAQIGLTALPQG